MNSAQPSPPRPLPESLWGNSWQFTGLPAEDLELRLLERPIPIRKVSPLALPSQQRIEPAVLIPGVLINAGRQSMPLSRWLVECQPEFMQAVNLELGALILTTSQQERWILATYQDESVREAALTFETRKTASSGIHFLLIQPDESGVTHTGLWIMQAQP